MERALNEEMLKEHMMKKGMVKDWNNGEDVDIFD